MQKINIFAADSLGGIQPYLSQSFGLKKAGLQVVLAAPEDFFPDVSRTIN
jgi:hypothetical protein